MFCYMLSDYLKEHYGTKLNKLLLSSGMTCPNRDGKCGFGGCIFCSSGGAGEFAQDSSLSVHEQIEREKKKIQDKSKTDKYIAYFQAFSNTYDTFENLRKLYLPVVERDDIAILSIATRPDCIDDEVIALLKELNEIKAVWIELGLQTANENTAKFIRRGYDLSVYENTVIKLRCAGITVITHLILGLPHESKSDMLASAEFAGKYSDGIKFHLLYVVKDTALAKMYQNGDFELLSQEEYIDILCECVRYVPKNVVIHRLTGDPDKTTLIAPKWAQNKIILLREIHNAFYDKNLIQGEYLKN